MRKMIKALESIIVQEKNLAMLLRSKYDNKALKSNLNLKMKVLETKLHKYENRMTLQEGKYNIS